jgi:hypothetical protein
MFSFFKNLLKKKTKDDQYLTLSINGETFTTNNPEEIAEILQTFSEALKKSLTEKSGK